MPLTVMERKHLLEHGAQNRVARKAGVSKSLVSEVVADEYLPKTERGRQTKRRVQVLVARELKMRLAEVFADVPPPSTAATSEAGSEAAAEPEAERETVAT